MLGKPCRKRCRTLFARRARSKRLTWLEVPGDPLKLAWCVASPAAPSDPSWRTTLVHRDRDQPRAFDAA